nr:MAG TPA: hypothetical protein [Caudoviricetes sp.]
MITGITPRSLRTAHRLHHHRRQKVLISNRMRKLIASSSFVIAPKYRLHQT